MTAAGFLRRLLFMPPGNPGQQERDVQAVEQELRAGAAQVRAVRKSLEKGSQLRELLTEVLDKTE